MAAMDLTRTAVRALAGACALTLLLAACGGDDDDTADVVGDDTEQTTEAADETTTSTEAPDETTTTAADDDGTTTTEADDPADPDDPDDAGGGTEGDPDAVALAQSINLTLDDFDEGWTETPPDDDDGGQNIDQCFETDIEAVTVGEAETGSFAYEPDEESLQITTMQTVVLDSPETAEAIVAEFRGDAFAACAADVMRSGFGEGAAVDVSVVPDEPTWTEESTGLVGDITVPDGEGAPLAGVVDLHVLRTDRVVSFTATIDVGVDGIEGLLGQIYGTIAERHATEVG